MDIEPIKARADSATPGPWTVKMDYDYSDHTIPERYETPIAIKSPSGRVFGIEECLKTAAEREARRLEWQKRAHRARATFKTLTTAEQGVVHDKASREATARAGARLNFRSDGPKKAEAWCYELTPGEAKAVENWDYHWGVAFVHETERLAAFKTAAPREPVEQGWESGRE